MLVKAAFAIKDDGHDANYYQGGQPHPPIYIIHTLCAQALGMITT